VLKVEYWLGKLKRLYECAPTKVQVNFKFLLPLSARDIRKHWRLREGGHLQIVRCMLILMQYCSKMFNVRWKFVKRNERMFSDQQVEFPMCECSPTEFKLNFYFSLRDTHFAKLSKPQHLLFVHMWTHIKLAISSSRIYFAFTVCAAHIFHGISLTVLKFSAQRRSTVSPFPSLYKSIRTIPLQKHIGRRQKVESRWKPKQWGCLYSSAVFYV